MLSLALGGDSVDRAVVRQGLGAELRALGVIATLRDDKGEFTGRGQLPVTIAQQGGPLWITDVLHDAVERDEAFRVGDGINQLRVEVIAGRGAYALQVNLHRQGWNLRGEQPRRVRAVPWVAVAAAIAGALSRSWTRTIGFSLLVAGLVAQLALLVLPWPSALPPLGWVEEVAAGPVLELARRAALSLPDEAPAIGAGVIVLCLVLIAFDHRRSRQTGGRLMIGGIAGVLGALAWIEAGARAGLFGYLSTAPGWIGLLAILGLWAWQWTRRTA